MPIKKRESGEKDPKTVFFVVSEGTTERLYLSSLGSIEEFNVSIIFPARGNKSSPKELLKSMQIGEGKLTRGSYAWIIMDKDNWVKEQRTQVEKIFLWSRKKITHHNRGVSMSCPSFELWLLFHFVSTVGCKSIREIIRQIEIYTDSKYHKTKLDFGKHYKDRIQAAIDNASKRYLQHPCCQDSLIPPDGTSTVYQLVEAIIGCKKR